MHDRLELDGWRVEIADAQKLKGLAPLTCKTDRIDAWLLAELARRDLVPAIWLPDPRVRAERERARRRLQLVRHRSSLKQRMDAVLSELEPSAATMASATDPALEPRVPAAPRISCAARDDLVLARV